MWIAKKNFGKAKERTSTIRMAFIRNQRVRGILLLLLLLGIFFLLLLLGILSSQFVVYVDTWHVDASSDSILF